MPRKRRCFPGRVSLYRDGIFVGRGQMALTPKDETLRLGFGADEKVKVDAHRHAQDRRLGRDHLVGQDR